MERLHTWAKEKKDKYQHHYNLFGHGGYSFAKYKVVFLCLVLMNAVLLIAAVALGVNCAKIKKDSLQVSHSVTSELLSKLSSLHSNHSDVLEAEEEAKRALDGAIQNHAHLKEQVEQLKIINLRYQRQLEALQAEKMTLQANMSALDVTCGRCPSGWVPLNSSCYFFSYTQSSTVKKAWSDSRADCVRRGSDLVVIDNQQEQMFVSHTIENMKSDRDVWTNGFWIGLHDINTEGTWEWINNVTEVEQRYWMDGEPNDHYTGEDCGVAVYSAYNPWKTRYDGRCRTRLHWICEKNQTD